MESATMSNWLDSWIKTHKLPEPEPPAWETFGDPARRARKFEKIDALPLAIKNVVHEYGWLTVKTLMESGVSDAKKMRSVIKTVLMEHSHEYRSRFPARKHGPD
jgi:hypothetical protein